MIEFTPTETAGAFEASTRTKRTRLLPSVDSPALAEYFSSLRAEASLVVLPLAPAQSLASQIRRLQPDAVVIASDNLSTTPWRHDSSLREAMAITQGVLLIPSINGAARRLAAELGIASVLPQDLKHRQLLAAIHAAAAGLVVTLPSPAAKPAHQVSPDSAGPIEKNLRDTDLVEHLTPREKAVLDRMAHGCGNKEFAAQLDISEHTAKFHVAQIIAKLEASSRAHAVAKAMRAGLVEI